MEHSDRAVGGGIPNLKVFDWGPMELMCRSKVMGGLEYGSKGSWDSRMFQRVRASVTVLVVRATQSRLRQAGVMPLKERVPRVGL